MSPKRELATNETSADDKAGIYTSKFKAFKAIYKPPKLRNLTHLNSSQPQPSENFNLKKGSNSRMHMNDARNTNFQEGGKPPSGMDFYISQQLMPAQPARKPQQVKQPLQPVLNDRVRVADQQSRDQRHRN